MRISRISALTSAAAGLALLSGAAGSAAAADYAPGSFSQVSERTWYLKGTIGMSNPEPSGMYNEAYASGDFTVGHTSIESGPLYGIGIGVEENRWLRIDVTGEYRGKQMLVGRDSYVGGANDYQANLEAWVGLANAYVDIGTWGGLTPYVGGGVGLASVSVLGLSDVDLIDATVYRGADHTETNFAWALYAGVSYDVTAQFTMDFAYRYLDLGSARSGVVSDVTALGSSYAYHAVEDITSHDLLLSGRWRLDPPVPAYALK